ncbi:MAG TPA: hypothetical protein VGI93_07890 [Steroidobacteraceae bacterium]
MSALNRLLLLLCLLPFGASSQSFVPKDLEGWQTWLLQGKPFLRCPFFANTDGADSTNRVCALPGRLSLDLTQTGGRFSQTWQTFTDSWIKLPGNQDNWPIAVTVNGMPGALVSRDNIPQIYVGVGSYSVAGQFSWSTLPESLAVADEAGLISLSLDGRKLEQVGRADSAIWLGKHRDVEVAKQMDLQVYRLLADGIPLMIETRLVLRVTGDAREEILAGALPPGIVGTALRSPLPARLEADGKLKLQVRAGTWTIQLMGRAPESLTVISLPTAQGAWPKQEIWSYRNNPRLRVAEIDGAPGVDPSQSNVPPEWRSLPSYRITAGSGVKIVEHSRGGLAQESNHLTLVRQLYLDFSHAGYTAVDDISGQMRTGWRLDMQPPFALAHASSETSDQLVTTGEPPSSTGIEIRFPAVKLATVARVNKAGGSIPATGWSERFEQVSGALILPPGHRLIAALGADQAPQAWIERWSLLDIFLVLMITALAFRFTGAGLALVAFIGTALSHQENTLLAWLLLLCLASLVLHRQVPDGRPKVVTRWLSYGALGLLLIQLVPFTVEQVRFAFYPQLADPPQLAYASTAQVRGKSADKSVAPRLTGVSAPAPPAMVAEVAVANPYGISSLATDQLRGTEAAQRYPPGALVQAGPGIPQWQYMRYAYGWSGPVEPTQTVRFVVLTPLLVALWRILGVLALVATFYWMTRNDSGLKRLAHLLIGRSVAILPLAFIILTVLTGTSSAADTPDKELLEQLKQRLSQPAPCVPTCAELVDAQVALEGSKLDISLEVSALTSLAVALPALGQHADFQSIDLDGGAVQGVYRDSSQQLWLALKPGVHHVKLTRQVASDSVTLFFPATPRRLTVLAPSWQAVGTSGSKLLGNTLQLTRRTPTGQDGATGGSERFAPFVVVQRNFNLGLNWSVVTRVERISPETGGFTLDVPLLPGESVLTGGIDTHGATQVPASFDSNAVEYQWESALTPTDTIELRAPKDKPWSEVWTFNISPLWHATFNGTPEVLPEALQPNQWTYEYYPRSGESLTIRLSRPTATAGNTIAVDEVAEVTRIGKRSSDVTLSFAYRSTQGAQRAIALPQGARMTSVKVDDTSVPPRTENGRLPLAFLPGQHQVAISWQSDAAQTAMVHAPAVDLNLASSNISTTLDVGARWVLFAGGRGVGPAILFWGELVFFMTAAVLIGLSGRTPLKAHEWLLLGLGLSTYSWFVLLLAFLWMMAIRWRLNLDVRTLQPSTFNALQVALLGLSLVAVLSLLAAIPFGLLGNPDMRIAGPGERLEGLSWFTDQTSGPLPDAWVFSLSLWWYKGAMLAWALWLALALTRWLPLAWRALNASAFWHRGLPIDGAAAGTSEPQKNAE